jgi:hypothetical protein
MEQQIRFYSISAANTPSNVNGIYFQEGGYLYKGASRFGANKVFSISNTDDLETSAETTNGKIEGDIAVGYGAARVWNGNQWLSLDNSTLNLSSTTASGSGNGITVSVTTQSGAVELVQVQASSLQVDDIDASSATFANISVDNIATFSTMLIDAELIEAESATFNDITATGSASFSNFTVGGNTVNEIAQSEIANAMVSEVRVSASASNDKLASELAVRNAIDSASLVWVVM